MNDDIFSEALHPRQEYGPVPFWWWVGESLDRGRLLWQLDRLREKGVLNAVVSYNHHADGTPNRGEPPVFSAEWWELLREMLEACRERGMQLSFQDYTLLNPLLDEIGAECDGMRGAGELKAAQSIAVPGEKVTLEAGPEGDVVAAYAYPLRGGVAQVGEAVNVSGYAGDGVLAWTVPEGDDPWLVHLCWCRPSAFDPLHAEAGARVIERFYAPFEREVGDHLGKTLPVSFQDELDFGGAMPRWSRRLPEEFVRRKGYELEPWLAALWVNLGPRTAKVRIDYADVVVALLEESYFIPVFQWHERHGLLFGNDNIGRGGIEAGRRAYGDPFRTMRWYSAPGTDDPALAGPRAFKGLKVNSSIAHLYGRLRVWNECFHSSGWGTLPSAVVAALNEDFALGATVVNLHGLYYSTFGGWWEWAPPDFHFRQPYWDDTLALSAYATRLCALLSRGVHVCDIAVVYPVTAIEGGLNPRVNACGGWATPVSEQQAGHAAETLDAAEAEAFDLGRELFRAGMDFDFIDFESIERAVVGEGELRVAGEAYRVLVLPYLSAVRFSTLEKARLFVEAGGLVIFTGCLPVASDRAGADDPALDALVLGLLEGEYPGGGGAVFIRDDFAEVRDAVVRHAGLDFDAGGAGFQVLHRRSHAEDLYFVFNPSKKIVRARVGFRAGGCVSLLNGWTGEVRPADAEYEGGVSRFHLELEAGAAALVVFGSRAPAGTNVEEMDLRAARETTLALPETWECEIEPTLDNRFGDFRWPPSEEILGPEARQFRFARECAGETRADWAAADFDDSAWRQVTASYGQRMWCLGPFPPGERLDELESVFASAQEINPGETVSFGGVIYAWTPYEFSLRWGIENDPFLKDWASGPHGLKGVVPDEFIDLQAEEPGAQWLLWTAADVAEGSRRVLCGGSRARYAVWLNGNKEIEQEEELPPGRHSIWNLPHYHCETRRKSVQLRAGTNPILIRVVQPAGQRTRAFAAFEPPPDAELPKLALRWFSIPGQPVFHANVSPARGASWFRFHSAPGLRSVRVVALGRCACWVDGVALRGVQSRERADGAIETVFACAGTGAQGSALVALRVEPVQGAEGGAVLVEPVGMECGRGLLRVGDWSAQGLAHYSGRVWYRQKVVVTPEQACGICRLELGPAAATAEVWVNRRRCGVLLAAPWSVEISGLLQAGENLLEVRVANTLANHYHVGIPTPYVPEGQTTSGLLGPVRIVFYRQTAVLL